MVDMGSQPTYIWQNGEIKPFADAKVHVLANAVFTGASVFEGIRGYWSSDHGELYLFRLVDHYRRLVESARSMRIGLPYPPEGYPGYLQALIRANEQRTDVHILHTLSVEGVGPSFHASPGRPGL